MIKLKEPKKPNKPTGAHCIGGMYCGPYAICAVAGITTNAPGR